jgi:hypothetical protein
MKSLAHQNRSELGGRFSVMALQKRDHIELDRLLHRLSNAAGSEQDRTLLKIYRLVFPHAFAEEAVLWPVMRRLLPEGQELTLRVELEHQQINELVARLETLDHASPERGPLLDRIIGLLHADVRDEEDLLLPRLQAQLTRRQLRRLGIAWGIVRQIAPTRAHPIVSRRPPGNVLSALPLSILDRCRDALDALHHRAPASPIRSVSLSLARAARAVERLPGMRRGEDPATRIGRDAGWSGGAAIAATGLIAAILTARGLRRSR